VQEVIISEEPLDVDSIYRRVSSGSAGAVDIFVGTVRNVTKGKKVLRLEYEAYQSMAIKEMQKISLEASAKWPIQKIVIHHRIGTLEIGDAAVVIAVSTPHRHDSFDACRYVIDTLKQSVPIWKKEVFEDGEVWVSAHP
jgi:molybdopterin synthase catalytic subunit